MANTLIVISGPTAVGKTSLAIELAQYYHSEIISADSRQFYREMQIGTAKPSVKELLTVKHHFVNSHSVTDAFSVGDFEREAIQVINNLFVNHNIAIMVGGSGLFINAIVFGFDDLPAGGKETRERLNRLFAEQGINYLQERLREIDPVFYHEVDKNNPQRLIRAIEVYEDTGKPFSAFRSKAIKPRPFNIVQIGLNTSREILYKRINDRVDEMIRQGLIEEAEKLKPFRHLNPLNTVGYSELFHYFDGNVSLDEAISNIKQNTRRFAKRQLTWFNKNKDIQWFDPGQKEEIISFVDSRIESLNSD